MATGYTSEEFFESSSSDFEDEAVAPGPVQVPKTVPLISKKAPRSFVHSERRLGERLSRDPYDRARKEQTKSIKETPPGRPKSNELVRSPSDGSQESSAVLSALSELTSTLNKVVKRLEKTECRIQSMEDKMDSTVSSSASDSRRKSIRKVPVIVRSETRKVYRTLMDEDSENFNGFIIGANVTFRDATNQAVACRLVKEVRGLNPTFDAADIRAAAYTYYKTLCQEQSLQRRGVSNQRKKLRRRRERIARKLQERQAIFNKLSYNERDKDKWKKVFHANFMSSEESDSNDEEVIVVRQLPWRSNRVTTFLHSLDDKGREEKSPQARRQMKTRRMGTSSSRIEPTSDATGEPPASWMFAMCNSA